MQEYDICPKGTIDLVIKLDQDNKELKERNVKLYYELGEAYKKIMVLENDLNEMYDSLPPI